MKKQAVLFPLVFLLLSMPLFAQQPTEISYRDIPELPQGIRGERIQALISTINANDPASIREFILTAFTGRFQAMVPMEEHIDTFLDMYSRTGGISFHSIRSYVPERGEETIVILKDVNFDSWRAFVISFDPDDDNRISGLQFADARSPSDVKVEALNEQEVIAKIRSIVEGLVERNVFSGAVLVAKGSDVLYSAVAGEASKRFHVSNNIDTKFNLGSMNKMFTSVAILQLVEKGKINPDDPLSMYLDETWLPKEVTEKITIHHLLTHTSGLGSYFNQKYMEGSRALWRKLDDYKSLIRDDRPAFEPGSRFQYSNTGMFLLGAVIEKVTGKSYFDFVRDSLFIPAGMKNTDCYEMDEPVENLAIGYSPDRNSPYGWKNNLYQHVIKGGPAGGGFSTVGDLFRFARALLGGKLVSDAALIKMWTDYSGEFYGYGFGIEDTVKGKIVGHSGGFDGINSNLDIFVDAGYIVAVMSNISNGASPLARKIQTLLVQMK